MVAHATKAEAETAQFDSQKTTDRKEGDLQKTTDRDSQKTTDRIGRKLAMHKEQEPGTKPNEQETCSTFKKPTVEDVAAYCNERNNGIDPQQFVNYYESKGWMVGRSPMKNWRAAVRYWERNATDAGNGQPEPPRKLHPRAQRKAAQ